MVFTTTHGNESTIWNLTRRDRLGHRDRGVAAWRRRRRWRINGLTRMPRSALPRGDNFEIFFAPLPL
jgi:hypothetical protein